GCQHLVLKLIAQPRLAHDHWLLAHREPRGPLPHPPGVSRSMSSATSDLFATRSWFASAGGNNPRKYIPACSDTTDVLHRPIPASAIAESTPDSRAGATHLFSRSACYKYLRQSAPHYSRRRVPPGALPPSACQHGRSTFQTRRACNQTSAPAADSHWVDKGTQ